MLLIFLVIFAGIATIFVLFNRRAAGDGNSMPRHFAAPRREGGALLSTAPSNEPRYSRIGLNYISSDGEQTDRVVTVIQLRVASDEDEHSTIEAWCHLREEVRTFRLDRIDGFFDPDTGEALKSVQLTVDPAAQIKACRPAKQLEDCLAQNKAFFEAHRWHVDLSFDEMTIGTTLSCFRPHKRTGKPIKTASIKLFHEPFFIDLDDSSGKQRRVTLGNKRWKPWALRHEGRFIDAWPDFEEAEAAFMKLVQDVAPETKL